ncbi:ATP-binding protein [Svornostia abyssi]|uniref:ATP-binding protein n=1 Tax=Svornostia abyssi TaxID=2898438 RepID=A0ABY5PDF0_9ACTN|nr:ATP-binding protein [Parviterribacteraceae bacterium J379]
MTSSSGDGERRALSGFVPQYKIAAEKTLAALTAGTLFEVGLADPKAKTLDDLQVITWQGAGLVLDAYQIKWAKPGEVLQPSELTELLAELIEARRAVIAAQAQRVADGASPVARVVAHLYSAKTPSTSARKGDAFDGEGRTVHAFLEQVWRPAEREIVRSVADVDPKWHAYLAALAKRCEITVDELLKEAVDLRVEVSQHLKEEQLDGSDWHGRDYLSDLKDLRTVFADLVTDPHREHVWVQVSALVERLGDEWKDRWHPRSSHEFPLAEPYEPLESSAAALQAAIDRYDHGYITLTGSPGSGKSTLLTRLLRADARVAARYYAYVPDNDSHWRGEADHFLHDLYLALATRRGHHALAPRRGDLTTLREAFREELSALGTQARLEGQIAIVVIDGLDHVARDPQPHQPLLAELPAPEEIPAGVVFVLGTRGLNDLPNHVKQVVVGGRHVDIEPLSRGAVIRLSESEGLGDVAELVADVSAGHPLMARTYLALAKDLDPADRAAAVTAAAPSSGEVWDFYEGVWETIAGSPDTVELLGTVSRIRGTIRLPWLLQTGSRQADIERLRRLRYLFHRSGRERWSFFHSSFREFLRRKTADVDGSFSEASHRHYHADLARRCAESDAQSPERFDRLFHLYESGEPQTVLREATPAFFREQADGMRPRADIQHDIQTAARALTSCHDPLGALNVSLAAFELQIRGYQYPETSEFLMLLAGIGQPELAVAHLREIDNGTIGHDRRSTAMKLARVLHRQGLKTEALRLFETHEPVEWLGGRASSLRRAPSGDRPSLWAWAKTAALLHGPEYVIETLKRLRPPEVLHQQERLDADEVAELRVDLLWVAGHSLLVRRRWEEADVIRAELVKHGLSAAEEIALFDLWRASYLHQGGEGDLSEIDAVAVESLPGHAKVELAWLCLQGGRRVLSQEIFETVEDPGLPADRHFDRRDRHGWMVFYTYWRLAAALGHVVDSVDAIPASDKDYLGQTILAARHLVGFAQLEGRGGASAAEIEAALSRLHSFWATPAGRHDHRRPSEVRAIISRQAIVVAGSLGDEATQRIFDYFERRWTEKPATRRIDSVEVIDVFAQAGIGEVAAREALAALESQTEEDDSSPDDWVELGLAWLRAGDQVGGARCAKRAVNRTLSLSSEKDLQLATWVKLIDPLLDGPDGETVCDAFVSALIELDRVSWGGSPDYAARILIERMAKKEPSRAWSAGRRLLEAGLIQADDVLVALLSASNAEPSAQWWIALGDLLVAFGVDVPSATLRDGVAADVDLARQWLPDIVERVAVEGRPTHRRSWLLTIRELAGEFSIEGLSISERDVEISEESPTRERGSETPSSVTSNAPPSIEEALARLESPDEDRTYDAARSLMRRIDELDDDQVRRLSQATRGTPEEPPALAAVAQRAMRDGDTAEAWRHGTEALRCSASTDWSRTWAGGPILQVIGDLLAIDRDAARPLIYERFAELADEVGHFLGSVGGNLDDYVEALELSAEQTARAAWEMARAILREVVELPGSEDFKVASDSGGSAQPSALAERASPIEAMLVWLIESQYTVAWEAAQRMVLALLRIGEGQGVVLRALQSANDEAVLRACAVVEAAAEEGLNCSRLRDALETLADSPRLSVRAGGASCLVALGEKPPALPEEKELPPALRLELPVHLGKRQIASGLRAQLLAFREEVDELAAAADLDEDALYAFVVERAVQLGGANLDDEAPSRARTLFGWGFVRPSAVVALASLDEAAAIVADARLVAPVEALRAAGLWPIYDTALLRCRPTRRPAEVVPFLMLDERGASDLYKRSASDLAKEGEARIVSEIDGWQVVGEWTELVTLDRLGPYERRVSGVTFGVDGPFGTYGQGLIRPFPASHYRRLTVRAKGEGVTSLRPQPTSMASPSSWLALDPGIGELLGLAADTTTPFDWCLDGELAVRTMWWRSGFDRWHPYSDYDEVGHGWLVLASARFMDRLAEQGRLLRHINVRTGLRGDGYTSPDEAHIEKTVEL